jgi:hypothetical protein
MNHKWKFRHKEDGKDSIEGKRPDTGLTVWVCTRCYVWVHALKKPKPDHVADEPCDVVVARREEQDREHDPEYVRRKYHAYRVKRNGKWVDATFAAYEKAYWRDRHMYDKRYCRVNADGLVEVFARSGGGNVIYQGPPDMRK